MTTLRTRLFTAVTLAACLFGAVGCEFNMVKIDKYENITPAPAATTSPVLPRPVD